MCVNTVIDTGLYSEGFNTIQTLPTGDVPGGSAVSGAGVVLARSSFFGVDFEPISFGVVCDWQPKGLKQKRPHPMIGSIEQKNPAGGWLGSQRDGSQVVATAVCEIIAAMITSKPIFMDIVLLLDGEVDEFVLVCIYALNIARTPDEKKWIHPGWSDAPDRK